MRRHATHFFLALSALLLCLSPGNVRAHSPEGTYSARADLRVDEQRGLRVRVWFEVPESTQIARGDAAAAVARLGSCLELTLGGEVAAGNWRAGDDPKHGLSNGGHTLYALEFEPATESLESTLVVSLGVGCFADEDLAFQATSRARSPWRVAEEALPQGRAHGAGRAHAHSHAHGHDAEDASGTAKSDRRARVVFERIDPAT